MHSCVRLHIRNVDSELDAAKRIASPSQAVQVVNDLLAGSPAAQGCSARFEAAPPRLAFLHLPIGLGTFALCSFLLLHEKVRSIILSCRIVLLEPPYLALALCKLRCDYFSQICCNSLANQVSTSLIPSFALSMSLCTR